MTDHHETGTLEVSRYLKSHFEAEGDDFTNINAFLCFTCFVTKKEALRGKRFESCERVKALKFKSSIDVEVKNFLLMTSCIFGRSVKM